MEGLVNWPTGKIQPTASFCTALELSKNGFYIVLHMAEEEHFMAHEHFMKFKCQCACIKFYWSTAILVQLYLVQSCF